MLLDIVFLIYLYQRWIYRVDKTRANEYGQVAEEVPTESNGATDEKEEVSPILSEANQRNGGSQVSHRKIKQKNEDD
jgi:hypothetical protein